MQLRWQILLAAAAAVYFLFRNLPDALLFLWPSLRRVRETDDDGSLDPAREPAMERVDHGLRGLGFAKIGAIELRPPLSSGWAELVYGSSAAGSFADITAGDGTVAVTFITPFAGGQVVMTSDFRRPTSKRPDYLAGGLPGNDVPELWAVHRRRIDHFTPPGGPLVPWADFSLAGRVRAEEAVYRGAGKGELRSRAAGPLLYTLIATALLVESVLQLVKLLRG